MSGLILSIATSFVIFSFLIGVYVWLASYPQYRVIYFPARRTDHGSSPARLLATSVLNAMSASSVDIETTGSIDASVYLHFLRACVMISALSSLYSVLVLVPICASDNFYEEYNAAQSNPKHRIEYSTFDLLGMGNVHRSSPRIWAFLFGAWWVTIVTCYVLYTTSEAITQQLTLHRQNNGTVVNSSFRVGDERDSSPVIRQSDWFNVESYTVLVRDIPLPPPWQPMQSHVDEYFRRLYPDSFVACLTIPSIHRATLLWNLLNNCESQLQQAQEKAPTGAQDSESKSLSITALESSLRLLRRRLRREQIRSLERSKTWAAFLLFNSQFAASQAAQVTHSTMADIWTVNPAPDPRAVRWMDLSVNFYERVLRTSIVWGAELAIIIFFLIPVTFVSAIANVQYLENVFQFLRPVLEITELKHIIDAFLPQLVLQLSLSAIPHVMRFLSSLKAVPSEYSVWESASRKTFVFMVFNVFIGLTVTGTIASSLQQIIMQPPQVFQILGTSVPANAKFFITYVALIFYVNYGVEICRIHVLLEAKFKRGGLDHLAHKGPPALPYYEVIPQDLLIITLGLCYALISPIILPFVLLYFLFATATYTHQIMNVYRPLWEGRGRFWPGLQGCILTGLTISQVTLIGYLGLNKSLTTIVLLPLPAFTTLFGYFVDSRFRNSFEYAALDTLQPEDFDPPSKELFEALYTPPCMQPVAYDGDDSSGGISTHSPLLQHEKGSDSD